MRKKIIIGIAALTLVSAIASTVSPDARTTEPTPEPTAAASFATNPDFYNPSHWATPTAEATPMPVDFNNCDELTRHYPDGVPSDHAAYQAKFDRNGNGWACES